MRLNFSATSKYRITSSIVTSRTLLANHLSPESICVLICKMEKMAIRSHSARLYVKIKCGNIVHKTDTELSADRRNKFSSE